MDNYLILKENGIVPIGASVFAGPCGKTLHLYIKIISKMTNCTYWTSTDAEGCRTLRLV